MNWPVMMVWLPVGLDRVGRSLRLPILEDDILGQDTLFNGLTVLTSKGFEGFVAQLAGLLRGWIGANERQANLSIHFREEM